MVASPIRDLKSFFISFYVYGCFVCMYICLPHVCLVPVEATVVLVLDGSEPSCGCWESNLSPLKEQPVLLAAEPSTQSSWLLLSVMKSRG